MGGSAEMNITLILIPLIISIVFFYITTLAIRFIILLVNYHYFLFFNYILF